MTQPGGYCTLAGCQLGSCPDEAVCVTFWQYTRDGDDRNRTSVNYCMRKCDDNSDCRDDEGYRCMSGKDAAACKADPASPSCFGYNSEATVEADPSAKFCAQRLPRPAMSLPDGSM